MFKRKARLTTLFAVLLILLTGCPESPKLPGDIEGTVKNAETTEPLEAATIKVIQTNDSTHSKDDGTYMLKNIDEGNYDIQASKSGYVSTTEDVIVSAGATQSIFFNLNKIHFPELSPSFLAFDLDSDSLLLVISNTGDGILNVNLIPGQNWINVSPSAGTISETDTITITINRTEISDNLNYDETIKLKSSIGSDEIPDMLIDVFVNGVYDPRSNIHYPVVRIGAQQWMAQNLNVGTMIHSSIAQSDNNILEKYCFNNIEDNCDIYGGLYQWPEMMRYNPSDTGTVGTTQGICPDGFHIPTISEWEILWSYLGDNPGGKLKETGTVHWLVPNTGATDEYGFKALPGGWAGCDNYFYDYGRKASFYSATMMPPPLNEFWAYTSGIFYNNTIFDLGTSPVICVGNSIRCVKNP